jgi:hypothetical protein
MAQSPFQKQGPPTWDGGVIVCATQSVAPGCVAELLQFVPPPQGANPFAVSEGLTGSHGRVQVDAPGKIWTPPSGSVTVAF